mgnify:CR=1 FL=1
MTVEANPLASKSGDVLPESTDLAHMPDAVVEWLDRFKRESWSGSITLHFNRGQVQSYEPKPNLRTVAK